MLVEPDTKKLGWGVVRFAGFLQDCEVAGDKEDSRALAITVLAPAAKARANSPQLLSARLIFDDHIRCMAAKQRLTKVRAKKEMGLAGYEGEVFFAGSTKGETVQNGRHLAFAGASRRV